MRLSAPSCYSPDALDTLDWDTSTAWKTVGGAETKRRLKDFSLNCNTAALRPRLTPHVHDPDPMEPERRIQFERQQAKLIVDSIE